MLVMKFGIRLVGSTSFYLARALNRRSKVGESLSVLDLGSGAGVPWAIASHYMISRFVQVTAVDSKPVLSEHGFSQVGSPFDVNWIKGDLLDILGGLEADSFDFAVAMDVIEHLSKEDGYRLMYEMNRVSSLGFAISTPIGFSWQPPASENVHQAHISAWTPRELRQAGLGVRVFHGFKFLTRGYMVKRYTLSLVTGAFYALECALAKIFPFAAAAMWAEASGKLPTEPPKEGSYTQLHWPSKKS